MTITECRKREKEYKRMLDNIELLKLALIRSIATEDMNIADLKKAKKGDTEFQSTYLNRVKTFGVC